MVEKRENEKETYVFIETFYIRMLILLLIITVGTSALSNVTVKLNE